MISCFDNIRIGNYIPTILENVLVNHGNGKVYECPAMFFRSKRGVEEVVLMTPQEPSSRFNNSYRLDKFEEIK
jgi:hypothetical protein